MWWGCCYEHNERVSTNKDWNRKKFQFSFIFRFYSCLDGVFHNLSISIGDQTSAKHIYDLFCDGVKDVISTCTCFLNECFEPNDMIKMQGKNLQLLQSVSFNFLIFLEIIILYITDFHWYFEVSIGHFWGSYKWDILFITDFYW